MRVRATVLSLAVAATLGGCVGTSSTFSCQNSDCNVNLSGAGADADLDSLGVTVRLAGVEDDEAALEVSSKGAGSGSGEQVLLAEGESAQLGGLELTCERIEGDEVGLTIGPG